jgi:hypothetical protein
MSEKEKKQSNRLGTIRFVALWTFSYAVGWAALVIEFFFLIGWLDDRLLSGWMDILVVFMLMLIGTIPGFFSGIIQQPLLHWKFGVHIKRWWLWTTIGASLATGAFFIYLVFLESILYPVMSRVARLNESLPAMTIMGVLFMIYSTFQARALRKTIHRAWLWMLAAFVSASTFWLWQLILFDKVFDWDDMNVVLGGTIGGLAQGVVMALTLVWLFAMTRTEAVAQDYDTSRLQLKSKNEDENQVTMESENQLDERYQHER